jgi:predicted signal transduction protein with EAL and GGDEF domain
LLLEHYLKPQHTKIETSREITVPKNLDFADTVYRKKPRLPLQKLGAFVHQYFVSLSWLTTLLRGPSSASPPVGMITTAEGVETKQQLEILRTEGCMQVQGFLFSKPVPGAEIPLLLQRLHPRIRAA